MDKKLKQTIVEIIFDVVCMLGSLYIVVSSLDANAFAITLFSFVAIVFAVALFENLKKFFSFSKKELDTHE